MATSYSTPGVFVEEISTLPASIAPVATAIPAFIGYTAQRKLNGVTFGINTPVRIKSLLEYEEIFGRTLDENFTVKLENPSSGSPLPTITVVSPTTWSPYSMYYQMQMYFGNGGGPCWIVSVGTIGTVTSNIDKAELKAGLNACEKEDEITLLVIPEIHKLSNGDIKELNDAMLAQCAKLQDRFSVMDVMEASAGTSVMDTGNAFRNSHVGSNNLKYGAAYFPRLKTTVNFLYDLTKVAISDARTAPANIYDTKKVSVLNGLLTPVNAKAKITVATPATGDKLTVAGTTFIFGADNLGDNIKIEAAAKDTAENIKTKIAANASLAAIMDATHGAADTFVALSAKGIMKGSAGNGISMSTTSAAVTLEAFSGGADDSDLALYNAIILELKKNTVTLYPAPSVCGVYASVDRSRGVWKAPANYSLNMVQEPNIEVTPEEQGLLNVDATSGKSINAIRTFTGKGVLVWGARTLAGNDNEWRYVPVRRLYIFVEESVKKSTEFVVFEPNDANTWTKVKTSITNFLTGLWRDGALAGAKPEDAFFVKIGLGVTMTSLDILEGRMNIEIGMAAVRPAEFIILKFSHLLAKS